MRLIDADYVLHKMNITDLQPRTETEHYAFGFAKEILQNAPTIEAEPVKHGTWAAKKPSRMKWIPGESDDITEEETTIEDMIEQKCSICQRWSIKFAYHIEMNFCPNCGARMDRDKK